MKKYIIYTLKRYIPLFAVTFAVCFSSFFFTATAIPTSTQYYINPYNDSMYYYGSIFSVADSGLIVLAIPLIVFSTILPFFANSYRYSLKSADMFNQIGKGKRSIRFVNNFVLLIACIVSFTAAFIFGLSVIILKQLPNLGRPDEILDYGDGTKLVTTYLVYNYGFYLLAYLVLIVVAINNYFISYFFVTRGNNFINSAICLVMGELILGVGLMTPIWYISFQAGIRGGNTGFIIDFSTLIGTRSATIISPIVWIYGLFNYLITGTGNSFIIDNFNNISTGQQITSTVLSFVCLAAFFGAGVLGLLYFLKEDESSGELAGKAPGRDKFQIILFHTGFGIISLWECFGIGVTNVAISFGLSLPLMASSIVFTGAMYYVFLGLLRRNFRPDKKEVIIMASVLGVNTLLGLSALFA